MAFSYQSKNTTNYKNQIGYGTGLAWQDCDFTWADMTMTWEGLAETSWSDQSKNTTNYSYQTKH